MADYGSKATCCRRMTAEELNEREAEGRPLDCGACAYKAKHDSLWPENAEAFSIYRALCGRTVGLLELHNWMFLSLTEGLSSPERHDVLARLDVIHDVLAPERGGHGSRDGSDPTRHRSE